MEYKEFVLNYKKINKQTPNQLEIEKLFKEYQLENNDNGIELKCVDWQSQSTNSLNSAIQSCDLDNVKYAISQNMSHTDNSIYFAIKTNNFELFKCVHNYVNKLTESDYNLAKICKNNDIIEYIDKLIHIPHSHSLFQSPFECKQNDVPVVDIKSNTIIPQILINAVNGKTKSNGGLNLNDFQMEINKLYPNLIKNSKMSRKDLEKFCKQQLDSLNIKY